MRLSIFGPLTPIRANREETAMCEPLQLLFDEMDTPIGKLVLAVDTEARLRVVDWADHDARMRRLLRLHYGEHGFVLRRASDPHALTNALRSYFAGDLQVLDRLPVATGGTPFQREVWTALRSIPRGQTRSYAELAASVGRPKAVRAVGLANGANPIGIVVPCHRVIGANGKLTGYGGGLHRKEWLLAHERKREEAYPDRDLLSSQPRLG
jgi:methylated-DNA-[protein]-cysteine S-methyltransferase